MRSLTRWGFVGSYRRKMRRRCSSRWHLLIRRRWWRSFWRTCGRPLSESSTSPTCYQVSPTHDLSVLLLAAPGRLNRQSRAERQNRTKLTVRRNMIAECNSYWQNITCTGTYIGRTWFILAEFNFYWQNITSTGRIWLPLTEHDLYWLIVTLAGRICSQWKVFCRSALLCCASQCVSASAFRQSVLPAATAAGLLLWARRPGDIDRLLHSVWVGAWICIARNRR